MNAGKLLGVESDYLIVGNGAAELIKELGNICTGKIAIQVPVFNEYSRCFKKCDFLKIESNNYDFCVPVEKIKDAIQKVDWVALVNPDNPSGSFIPYNEILEILEECEKKNTKIIIDESFIDFAEEKIRYTLLDNNLLSKYKNLIVIKSISKSYGVPGLRLGVLATSDKMLIKEIRTHMAIWNINSFGEYFLQIHRLYETDYKNACNKIVYQRINMMNELAQNKYIKVYPSQANYIMCQLLGDMTAKELANILVKKYNILIKDLSLKDGIVGEKFIRLAVKDFEDNKQLINAIKEELF